MCAPLPAIIDPANQETDFVLDAFGNPRMTQSADTGATTRTFDEAGNLKSETDARGVTVSYTYDALNRVIQKQSSQSGSPVYTYVYDTCGKGRLCWIQRTATSTSTSPTTSTAGSPTSSAPRQ